MWKPSVVGKVWNIEDSPREFRNKETGKVESYVVRMIDILITKPVREMLRVRVLGEAALVGVVVDKEVTLQLHAYSVENNQPVVSCRAEDIRLVGV